MLIQFGPFKCVEQYELDLSRILEVDANLCTRQLLVFYIRYFIFYVESVKKSFKSILLYTKCPVS